MSNLIPIKLAEQAMAVRDGEIAILKAEVERLTEIIRREVDGGVDLREEAQRTVEENHKLRAEVERLRKAGDALYDLALPYRREYYPEGEAWYLAKKGKPSV